MNTKRLMHAALLPLFASLALVGCDSSPDNSRPKAAMPIQEKPVKPAAPPSTVEEKIKAIQAAPISEKEKKAAIERVRSGSL